LILKPNKEYSINNILSIKKEYEIKKRAIEQKSEKVKKAKLDYINILLILGLGIFLGSIIWVFIQLFDALSNFKTEKELVLANYSILDGFYAYYGKKGVHQNYPSLRINSSQNITLKYGIGKPTIKNIYFYGNVEEKTLMPLYMFLENFPYPYTIITTASEIENLPEGVFLVFVQPVIDKEAFEALLKNPRFINVVFISSSLPRSKSGAYLFTIPVSESIISPIKTNIYKTKVSRYHIPDQNVDTFISYFEQNNKLFILIPNSIDDKNIMELNYRTKGDLKSLIDLVRADFITFLEDGRWVLDRKFQDLSISEGISYVTLPIKNKVANIHIVAYSESDFATNIGYQTVNLIDDLMGEIFFEKDQNFLLPFNISKLEETFSLVLKLPSISESLSYAIFDSNGKLINQKNIGEVLSNIPTSYRIKLDMDEGNYLLVILNSNGIYTRQILPITNIYVTAQYIEKRGEKPSILIRTKSKDGSDIVADKIELSFNNKVFTEQYTSKLVIPLDSPLTAGTHTLSININDKTYTVSFSVRSRTAIMNLLRPDFMAIALLSAIIFFGGKLIRPKQEITYHIDVPDFAPIKTIEVKMTRQEIKDIFYAVNKANKWNNYPITEEELIQGLRSNVPILKDSAINPYNLVLVLEQLKNEGIVKEYEGYYGLTEWETVFNIKQLAIYRKIRDHCLGLGLLPTINENGYIQLETPLGNMYIFIYDSSISIEKINYRDLNGMKYIVFANNIEMKEFYNKVIGNSYYLYLELDLRNNKLIAIELEEFLAQLSTMFS